MSFKQTLPHFYQSLLNLKGYGFDKVMSLKDSMLHVITIIEIEEKENHLLKPLVEDFYKYALPLIEKFKVYDATEESKQYFSLARALTITLILDFNHICEDH
ncbi:hypothetical protein [Pedobacter sp.]|uniref:hypothetical protein n=1 Tax=Pedobacter sp. TaxID=1411316 RepID=UPI003BAB548B